MANAGYEAVLYVSGTSTAMVDEACGNVSGKIYQITDTAKRLLDPAVAIVVEDNGSVVAAGDIESIDLLFGKVTLAAAYAVTGSITISANYLPLAIYGVVKSWSAQLSRDILDSSVMDGVSSHRQKKVGLKDASGSIGALDFADTSVGGSTLYAKHTAATPFILAFGPEGTVTTDPNLRARVLLEGLEVSAEVAGLVDDSLSFVLAATTSVGGFDVSVSLDS